MSRYENGSTVTVVRGETDRYGDWSITSEHEIPDVVIYPTTGGGRPAGSYEPEAFNNQTTITGFVLLPPAASDFRSDDRVRLPGEPADSADWQVVGEVADFLFPFEDWQPGAVVMIERVK